MKKIITALALIWPLLSFAQTGLTEVTLLSMGFGDSHEEAISNALANVVEQTLGTVISVDGKGLYNENREGVFFIHKISEDTSPLWDEAKESSGIIAKSEVLLSLSNERITVVMATVVLENIVSFLNGHGIHAELMGNSFTLPIRIRELKERNETCSLNDFLSVFGAFQMEIFDLELIPDSLPKRTVINNVPGYLFLNTVNIYPNEYSDFYYHAIHTLLGNLSLSKQEVNDYKESGLSYSSFTLRSVPDYPYSDYGPYYLRCDARSLEAFINNAFGRGGGVGACFFEMNMDIEIAGGSDKFFYSTDWDMFDNGTLGQWLLDSEYESFSGAKIQITFPLCHEALKNFISDFHPGWPDTVVRIPFFSRFQLSPHNETEIITSLKVPYFVMESDMDNVLGFKILHRQTK